MAARKRGLFGVMRRVTLGAAVLLAAVLQSAAASSPVPASPTDLCSRHVFNDAFRSHLEDVVLETGVNRLTAAVTDTRTRCSYDLNPTVRITTASVIKAEILAATLLRSERAGQGALDLTNRTRAERMMWFSHNSPPTSLLWSLAGQRGMEEFSRAVGATATLHTPVYGATVTSARDRNAVVLELLHSGSVLSDASRAEAWTLMSSVHPTQQWGVSAGLPSGWTFANKNGFFPSRGAGWRTGTTGFARPIDSVNGYAITVMVDGAPTQLAGMQVVETITAHVAAVLADGAPAPRAFDGAQCVTTSAGSSWQDAAIALMGSAARADDVRWVNGNEGPLRGQLLCSPEADAPVPAALPLTERLDAERALGRTYQAVFARTPDPGGFLWWYEQLRAGMTRTEVASAFAASPEFIGENRVGDEAFVGLLYRNAFGRNPDAAGEQFWVSLLRSGVARGEVVVAFADAPEFSPETAFDASDVIRMWRLGAPDATETQIVNVYCAVLNREPGASDFAGWRHATGIGFLPISEVASSLVISSEFQSSHGAPSGPALVDLLYRNLLDRAPDRAGAAFWISRFETSADRGSVVAAFADSAAGQGSAPLAPCGSP